MHVLRQAAEVFEQAGCKTKWLTLAHIDETVRETYNLFHSGKLGPAFSARYQHKFRLDWQPSGPTIRSAILLAVPVHMLLLRFHYHGAQREIAVPPGYACSDTESRIWKLAETAFGEAGHDFQWLRGVPLKLLAVRSGLCLYGRNNITYCEELGSFIELYGFVTDMDAPKQIPWYPSAQMPECAACTVCAQACPSACIDLHSPIIHAERCLTYLNENGGDFPAWLKPSAHHTAVGCMICQRACPKNRGHLSVQTVESAFDKDEIDAICAGGEFHDLPEKTQKTLKSFDLDDYWPKQALSRNIRALLAKKRIAQAPGGLCSPLPFARETGRIAADKRIPTLPLSLMLVFRRAMRGGGFLHPSPAATPAPAHACPNGVGPAAYIECDFT